MNANNLCSANSGALYNFGGNALTAGQIAAQVTMHATVGGVMSVLQGGKFGHGFVSAGVTKGFTNVQLAADDIGEGFGAVVAGLIGGTVSEATGGKFANGFQTSVFQYLFNAASAKVRVLKERYDFKKIFDAYQDKADMLEGKSFSEWALGVINDPNGGSCAVRLSNALNRAGYKTLDDAFKNTHLPTIGDGVSDDRYMTGALNLAKHLGVYAPSNLVTDVNSIIGKKGFIFFNGAGNHPYTHIDLWDKSGMKGNGRLPPDVTNRASIYFVELK